LKEVKYFEYNLINYVWEVYDGLLLILFIFGTISYYFQAICCYFFVFGLANDFDYGGDVTTACGTNNPINSLWISKH